MSEPFIGQIMIFGGNFPPKGWAFCDGSLMAISQNTALFSILGTMYGGDGRTTFGLPDLRGRVPIGMGSGPGLSSYTEGQMGGQETHTLLTTEMPAHTHAVAVAASNEANTPQNRPGGNVLGAANIYDLPASADAALGGVSCGSAGGGQPHENRQPYLAMNYIIALAGIFPSRS
ncbi:MAG: phage tail protein [Bryobacterales bacterium]|nr:phage tail protein [Bryobacterales bacterium]